jgi:large subunit ribosomal protein L23
VLGVSVALMKGKTKQTKYGLGKRSNWKKAYVRLEQGQEIDFATVE